MLALLLALPLIARPPEPVRLHYRVTSISTIDLGTGGAPLVLRLSAFVTIALTDSAAGTAAAVSISWSTFDGGAMAASLPPQLQLDPRDVTLRGYVRDGLLVSLVPSGENLQVSQLVPAIRLAMTATRIVKPGDRWVDSMIVDTSTAVSSTRRQLITAWTASPGSDGSMEFRGDISGTVSLHAGAMQLDLPTAGLSRLTTRNGTQVGTASLSTTGHGNLKLGAGVVSLTTRNEVSATLFPTAAWAAIP